MNPIERYLKALADPKSTIDQAQVKKLENQIKSAKDPMRRVKLRAQLAEAKRIDVSQLEDEFVQALPAWIKQEGIAEGAARVAFSDEGVPKAVLDRALRSGTRVKAKSGAGRRTRVSRETIEEAIPAKGEAFTTHDVQKASGASYATVRSVVADLVESGQVKEMGPDPSYHGRGKKPVLYERKK